MQNSDFREPHKQYSIFSSTTNNSKSKNCNTKTTIRSYDSLIKKNSSIPSKFQTIILQYNRINAFGSSQQRFGPSIYNEVQKQQLKELGPGTYELDIKKYQSQFNKMHKKMVPFGSNTVKQANQRIWKIGPGSYEITQKQGTIKKNVIKQNLRLKPIIKKQQSVFPGPGQYNIDYQQKKNRTYRNIFKQGSYYNLTGVNLDQIQTISEEQNSLRQQKSKKEQKKLKVTREQLKLKTIRYLDQLRQLNEGNKIQNQKETILLCKNTNPFVKKQINLYGSYITKNQNPGPAAYNIPSVFSKLR